ncbi:MAG: VIT1/CCC1 family predicted Fe2+/Mn2+ transporter [Saprospiraceae bacterium]|jgi:VIT1/CCC1 family predicted Fe2+/Mn2+ transporter
MMKEELELMEPDKTPLKIGGVTFLSFLIVGFIPLTIYVWDYLFTFNGDTFWTTCLLTSLGFIMVGWLKSVATQTSRRKEILETLTLGIVAAGVAYFVGDILEKLI